ncbi:MAG: alpha/beta hydrolase-fold protein, partial [Mycobacteriales bacterium]
QEQATALAAGNISALYAEVSFAKLLSGLTDNSAIPTAGPMDRIFASHFTLGPGLNFAAATPFQSQLQPYAIYVPTTPPPQGGYCLTLLLHALTTNYNLFLGSRNQSELGQTGRGSIVVTPEARGPAGNYISYAGADVFEAWANVAASYHLDPSCTAISGYSMGGIGTFKLAEQFPDLFGKAFTVSGTDQSADFPSTQANMLPSLRHVPLLMWNMVADEEVPFPEVQSTATELAHLGYRYILDEFTPGEHNTFAIYDQYQPGARFLANPSVNYNPAHVTYVVNQSWDYPGLNFVADHAYWLSGVAARSSGALGTIDAVSHGFGVGNPVPSGTQLGTGVLSGGNLPLSLHYASQYQTWGPVPGTPAADLLVLRATNISSVTIDVARARLNCDATIRIITDGPITVHLARCDRTISAVTNAVNVVHAAPSAGGASSAVGGAPASQPVVAHKTLAATGANYAISGLGALCLLGIAALLRRCSHGPAAFTERAPSDMDA